MAFIEEPDKATLGVTDFGGEILTGLMKRDDLFSSEAAAFKSAVALALSLGLEPTQDPFRIKTKWGSGGTMSDLMELVGWYGETDRPVDLANRLADAGLRQLAEQVKIGAPVAALYSLKSSIG